MIDLNEEELEQIRKTIEMAWDVGGNYCSLKLLQKLGFNDNNFVFNKMREEIEQEQKLLNFKEEQERLLKKKLKLK